MTKEQRYCNSVSDAGEQLKALGHDDHPNVGILIGYSYRKLGDYKILAGLVRARSAHGGKWHGRSVADAECSIFAARVCFTGHTD
jgi:hypothetical protein